MLFEFCVEVQKLLVFLRTDLACGNLCPEFNDAGQIINRQRGFWQLFQFCNLRVQLKIPAAEFRHAGIIVLRLFGVLREHGKFQIVIGMLLFKRFESANVLIFQVHIRACFIDQVDGLIRQETVGNVAFGEQNGLARNLRQDHDTVERLIIMADAADDGDGLLDGRLGDGDGLKAAFECSVFFDMFAVLVESRCSDDLDFPS